MMVVELEVLCEGTPARSSYKGLQQLQQLQDGQFEAFQQFQENQFHQFLQWQQQQQQQQHAPAPANQMGGPQVQNADGLAGFQQPQHHRPADILRRHALNAAIEIVSVSHHVRVQ